MQSDKQEETFPKLEILQSWKDKNEFDLAQTLIYLNLWKHESYAY